MTTHGAVAALERTGRAVVAGTWGCAAIVMVTSAGNAVLTFGELGGNRAIGLGLGVAVDIALCVGLIGDRRLAANGRTSAWGRALRITAAGMSLVLNVGAAVIDGRYFLAVLHAFLPLLLITLTEYGQDLLLELTRLGQPSDAPVLPVVSAPGTPPAAPPIPPASRPVPSEPPPPAAPAPSGDLTDRVRRLVADTAGKPPGRRTVARQLGISEHQARNELALAAGPGLNGTKPGRNTHA